MIVMHDRADDRRTLTRRPAIPTVEELADVLDLAALAWQADALCAQIDSEVFFPELGQPSRAAKRVCSMCTVRAECLAYALETRQTYGIWGGASEREREAMRMGRIPAVACSPT